MYIALVYLCNIVLYVFKLCFDEFSTIPGQFRHEVQFPKEGTCQTTDRQWVAVLRLG